MRPFGSGQVLPLNVNNGLFGKMRCLGFSSRPLRRSRQDPLVPLTRFTAFSSLHVFIPGWEPSSGSNLTVPALSRGANTIQIFFLAEIDEIRVQNGPVGHCRIRHLYEREQREN